MSSRSGRPSSRSSSRARANISGVASGPGRRDNPSADNFGDGDSFNIGCGMAFISCNLENLEYEL